MGDRDTIFLDDSISEGELPSPGVTHFCFKTGKSLGEDLHPKGKERIYKIYDSQFSKLNVLRKGKSGAYSQEEACLHFSEAEGNVKSCLGQFL